MLSRCFRYSIISAFLFSLLTEHANVMLITCHDFVVYNPLMLPSDSPLIYPTHPTPPTF